MKEAVRLMGHSDEKMIMEIYAHLDKLKSNSRSKLNNYINQELESVTLKNARIAFFSLIVCATVGGMSGR